MVIGTPCSGPSFLPALTILSAALARLRAASMSVALVALSVGLRGLDALEIEVEQLEAADLLLPDRGGELLGGLERQGKGHWMGLSAQWTATRPVPYCPRRREETPASLLQVCPA